MIRIIRRNNSRHHAGWWAVVQQSRVSQFFDARQIAWAFKAEFCIFFVGLFLGAFVAVKVIISWYGAAGSGAAAPARLQEDIDESDIVDFAKSVG